MLSLRTSFANRKEQRKPLAFLEVVKTMNKVHKSVWNEATGTWVAVSELSAAKRKRSTKRGHVAAVVLGAGAASMAPSAFAGAMVNCAGNGMTAASSQWVTASTGAAWDGRLGEGECGGGSGVLIGENNSGNGGVNGSTAYVTVGKTAYNGAGAVTLYGPSGIALRGATTTTGTATFQAGANMSSTRISSLADGVNGKDAVNLDQMNRAIAGSTAGSIDAVK
jgi:uncharacterized low-complexity protein